MWEVGTPEIIYSVVVHLVFSLVRNVSSLTRKWFSSEVLIPVLLVLVRVCSTIEG